MFTTQNLISFYYCLFDLLHPIDLNALSDHGASPPTCMAGQAARPMTDGNFVVITQLPPLQGGPILKHMVIYVQESPELPWGEACFSSPQWWWLESRLRRLSSFPPYSPTHSQGLLRIRAQISDLPPKSCLKCSFWSCLFGFFQPVFNPSSSSLVLPPNEKEMNHIPLLLLYCY